MPGNPQALAAAQAAQKSMIKPQSPAMNPMAQRQDLSSMGPAQNAGMGKPTPPMGGLGGLSKFNDASPTGTMGGMGKPTPPMGMGAMAARGGMAPALATMGGMAKPMGMKKGGAVKRDGVAKKGKTKGRIC